MRPERMQLRAMDSTRAAEEANLQTFADGGWPIAQVGGQAREIIKVPSILLLFAAGRRPDKGRVRQAVGGMSSVSNSLEPADGAGWLELHSDGLVFDLSGLSPAAQDAAGLSANDLSRASPPASPAVEAMALRAAHTVARGATMAPVLQAQALLAAGLADKLPDCCGVVWRPSARAFDPARLADAVRAWNDGGSFPAELYIALRDEPDGGMVTRGLQIFTGQELRLEPDIAADRSEAEGIALRLAGQLVAMGKLDERQEVALPDGRVLRLEPSPNGRFVRAFPG